ncbi:MAG TPA: ATP-grasp fold amidoligase family protein, partial [Dongiaceae bacterium]|nr:ATP-grasp fold amidoligase family protein [Dongiaceae bacterium]
MHANTTKSWKRRLLGALPGWLQIAIWAVRRYRWKFGRWPNLIAPQTFNELILLRKISNRDPRILQLADKLLVKDYVREKLGDEWVIPTLWSGKHLPPRDQRDWPRPFVIKANNGCGRNIFVRDQKFHDWDRVESRCDEWMSSAYGLDLGEWHYARMPARIMVEPFINVDLELPVDVKFLVFHGCVEFIYVVVNREHGERQAFFDRNWNRVPYGQGFEVETAPVPAPACLTEMIRGAEILAADFSFVRVDLYE